MEEIFNAKPHGITFHHFHDEIKHVKGQGSITSEQFNTIILLLKSKHEILSAHDWYNAVLEGKLMPNQVCITFDDNLLCQYEIALPVLEKHNITAFWFVYTSPLVGVTEKIELYRYFLSKNYSGFSDFYNHFRKAIDASEFAEMVNNALRDFKPETYLSEFSFYTHQDRIYRYLRDQVLKRESYRKIMDAMIENSNLNIPEIAKILWTPKEGVQYLHKTGHIIGLHSHTHPTDIKQLSLDEQKQEYETNYFNLKNILNEPITTIAHPSNSYNNDTLQIMESLGIQLGFRANMKEGFTSKYEYPRIDHTYIASLI